MDDKYQLKQLFLNESRTMLIRLFDIPESCESNVYISVCND